MRVWFVWPWSLWPITGSVHTASFRRDAICTHSSYCATDQGGGDVCRFVCLYLFVCCPFSLNLYPWGFERWSVFFSCLIHSFFLSIRLLPASWASSSISHVVPSLCASSKWQCPRVWVWPVWWGQWRGPTLASGGQKSAKVCVRSSSVRTRTRRSALGSGRLTMWVTVATSHFNRAAAPVSSPITPTTCSHPFTSTLLQLTNHFSCKTQPKHFSLGGNVFQEKYLRGTHKLALEVLLPVTWDTYSWENT